MKDGGQAFPDWKPTKCYEGTTWGRVPGMTLRDYFAGQCLVGDIASYANPKCDNHDMSDPKEIAEWCYQVADALIAQKTKENG